jgi:hypothetical protein
VAVSRSGEADTWTVNCGGPSMPGLSADDLAVAWSGSKPMLTVRSVGTEQVPAGLLVWREP